MATPHNEAGENDFASMVLMPGDPLRAKFIAERYLDDARLVNNVRGIGGYTGTYRGERISVMASGMGMPSMGIYSYELYKFYNVDNIIRIGSAGGIAEGLKLRDIVIAMGCSTNSNYAAQYGLPGTLAPLADYRLLSAAAAVAERKNADVKIGNVLSSDCFYNDDPGFNEKWGRLGVLAVEMESAALYYNAARLSKGALSICTISDHVIKGGELTAAERQETLSDMVEIALETAYCILTNPGA